MDLEGSSQDVQANDEFPVNVDLDEDVIEVEVEQSGVDSSKPLKKNFEVESMEIFRYTSYGGE